MIIIITLVIYFCILLLFSKITSRRATNDTFYRGNRHSPWYMVAFGMVGASISGVTFVSVPGMVNQIGMTYIQTCLGFIVGYFLVAFLLLPIYYRLNLTTIYSYLDTRIGKSAYKTGASFFLLSKITGATVRFYVVCMILQRFVFDDLGVPFTITVTVMVALIWLYTRRGGINTLVWTDSFQTFCMFSALLLIIYKVIETLGMTPGDAVKLIAGDERSSMFILEDMMQKNLTCKTLREAQKDMCSYGFAFVPVNLLFMALGILLSTLAVQRNIALPAVGDELLPMFAASGELGTLVTVLFTIGIVAASFSSADSSHTALTTTYCVDIREQAGNESLRKRVHLAISMLFIIFILLFRWVNSTSVIDAIYILCAYTYGPLLGLFAFGLLTKRQVNNRAVIYVAVAAPLICYVADFLSRHFTSYQFGYELLMLNGMLTFIGLWITGYRQKQVV